MHIFTECEAKKKGCIGITLNNYNYNEDGGSVTQPGTKFVFDWTLQPWQNTRVGAVKNKTQQRNPDAAA